MNEERTFRNKSYECKDMNIKLCIFYYDILWIEMDTKNNQNSMFGKVIKLRWYFSKLERGSMS